MANSTHAYSLPQVQGRIFIFSLPFSCVEFSMFEGKAEALTATTTVIESLTGQRITLWHICQDVEKMG